MSALADAHDQPDRGSAQQRGTVDDGFGRIANQVWSTSSTDAVVSQDREDQAGDGQGGRRARQRRDRSPTAFETHRPYRGIPQPEWDQG